MALHNSGPNYLCVRIQNSKIDFFTSGAIPIPGTSLMLDMVTFDKEKSFQQKQLGIDKISLMKKAELLEMIKEDLLEVIIGRSSDNEMMKSYYRLMLKSEELMEQAGIKIFHFPVITLWYRINV